MSNIYSDLVYHHYTPLLAASMLLDTVCVKAISWFAEPGTKWLCKAQITKLALTDWATQTMSTLKWLVKSLSPIPSSWVNIFHCIDKHQMLIHINWTRKGHWCAYCSLSLHQLVAGPKSLSQSIKLITRVTWILVLPAQPSSASLTILSCRNWGHKVHARSSIDLHPRLNSVTLNNTVHSMALLITPVIFPY